MADETELDLQAAVEKALKETPEAAEKKSPVVAEPKETTEEKETSEEIDKTTQDDTSLVYEDGLTEKEIIEARQVFNALKNPETRGQVIDLLASQSGYKKGDTPSKEEVKQKTDNLLDELKAGMQPEFHFLADQFAPALEQVINKRLGTVTETAKKVAEASTQDLRKQEEERQLRAIEQESNTAMKEIAQNFYKEGEFPDNIAEEMSKYMDRRPPIKGQSAKEYIQDAFFVAAGKHGGIPDKIKQEKQDRARNNAPRRLQETASTSPQPGRKEAEYKSAKEAVAEAMQQLAAKQ